MGKWCFLVPKNNFAEYFCHIPLPQYILPHYHILIEVLLSFPFFFWKDWRPWRTRLFLAYVPRYPDTAPAPPIPFSLYNISFDSYIKPQLPQQLEEHRGSCISFDSYIKPQQLSNLRSWGISCISFDSYIKPQLLCVSSGSRLRCISFDSYIKPQLVVVWCYIMYSCISFDSYIKPQPTDNDYRHTSVVYLLIPTSNHNYDLVFNEVAKVVYLLIPTSNHNMHQLRLKISLLYIFWFLHQTTTPHQ